MNVSRPSEHPTVRGENAKTFRWDHRLQRQNFVVFVVVFVLMLSLKLCRCSSDIFLSSRPRIELATAYITGYG